MASHRPCRMPTSLRFLTPHSLPSDVYRLSNQVLVITYEAEWGKVIK